MPTEPNDRCVFCGNPAGSIKPDPDRDLHDIDCDLCGKYRIGGTTQRAMLALREPWHADSLPLIAEANARKKRYWVPGGDEIPLR
jgi:hypothetical protein